MADQLERTVADLGLTKFGEVGDPFDPTIHEALSHIGEDPDVKVTTCKVIAKAGYRIGERVVRAAQVLVVDPSPESWTSDRTRARSQKPDSGTATGEGRCAHGRKADWATKDYYKELGVSKDATADEIKKAYRKLAHANHPDNNPGNAAKHDKFKAVAEAYDVIGDPEKRKQYDDIRSAPLGGFGGGVGARRLRHQRPPARAGRRLRRHVRRPLRWRSTDAPPPVRARAPTWRPPRPSASTTPSRASRSACG